MAKVDRVERPNGSVAAGGLTGVSGPLPKAAALQLIEALAVLGENLPVDVMVGSEVGGASWRVEYEVVPCQHPEVVPGPAGVPSFDAGPDDAGYIGDGA